MNMDILNLRKQIEHLGLTHDPIALRLYEQFVLNPESKKAASQLQQYINRHPHSISKIMSGNPFSSPPYNTITDGSDFLVIGIDEYGNQSTLPITAFSGHAMFTGETGSGKTTLLRNIAIQLIMQGHKVMFFDYKKDMRQLIPHIKDLLVLTVCEEPNFQINPLQAWPGVSQIQHDMTLIKTMSHAFFLADGSINLLLETLTALRKKQGKEITFRHWHNYTKNWNLKSFKTTGWKDSAMRAMNSIMIVFEKLIDCLEGIPAWEIIENFNVVIELNRVSDEHRTFWADYFLSNRLNYKMSNDIRKD